MQADNTIDQLLARAILDLELKMKHEMRQNSAIQLAKMEKHHQQMEKRLVIVEAKLEALLNRDNNSGVPQNSRNRSNNRQQYVTGKVNRPPTSYYQQTASLVNAQSDKRVFTPVRRGPTPYGMLGIGSNSQPQYRHASGGKQQQRPKQIVGTGSNKTQLGEKPSPTVKNEAWTTKLGGIYTSGEESGEENGSHTDSELGYSVAKPAPPGGEILSDEEEKPQSKNSDIDEEEKEGEIVDEDEKKTGQEENENAGAGNGDGEIRSDEEEKPQSKNPDSDEEEGEIVDEDKKKTGQTENENAGAGNGGELFGGFGRGRRN